MITTGISVPNVPQSTVLAHCLAAGLVSALQLDESQVTAPGVPDLPAATPHFVAHPLGSACFQLPNSVGGWPLNNLSTKHLDKRTPALWSLRYQNDDDDGVQNDDGVRCGMDTRLGKR